MKVGIVIPIYKEYNCLNELEIIALIQAIRVLNRYMFNLIHPKNMDIAGYDRILSDNGISHKMVSFNNNYFSSTVSYSRLLLSKIFYQKFLEFEYILIISDRCICF